MIDKNMAETFEKANIINDDSEKLKLFRKTVISDAETASAEELSRAKQYKSDVLEKVRAECDLISSSKYNSGFREVQNEFRTQVAKKSFEFRCDVLRMRTELTDKFFESLKNDLEQFSCSEKYVRYLSSAISEITDVYPIYDGVILYVRENDVEIAKKLPSAKGMTVEPSVSIKHGGIQIYYPRDKFFADNTFDRELEVCAAEFTQIPELAL